MEKERGRGGGREREWISGYGSIVRVQNGLVADPSSEFKNSQEPVESA